MEYKECWHDKYLVWICGFANTQVAVMYFGVNDERKDGELIIIGESETK